MQRGEKTKIEYINADGCLVCVIAVDSWDGKAPQGVERVEGVACHRHKSISRSNRARCEVNIGEQQMAVDTHIFEPL